MGAPASFSARVFSTALFGVALFGLLALTGCRDYGGDYGNTEKMYEQLAITHRLLSEDLERARADLNLLARAAQDQPALEEHAEQWRRLVLFHEATLDENHELIADVDADDYRAVHRLYGAMLSEGRLVRDQYQSLLRAIAQTGDTTEAAPYRMYTEAQYWVAPTYYERVQSAQERLTMRQALQSAFDLRRSGENVVRTLEDPSDEPGGAPTPEPEEQQ